MDNRYQKNRPAYTGPREAAILKSTKEGWMNVSMPYEPRCIEDLKSYLEPSGRRWNPDTKFWEVKEIYLETLITILKKHFGDNVTQDLTTAEETNAFKAVFIILKDMPNGNLDRVYSALAQAVHPDHGGSTEQMKLLNDAYQEVKH